MSNHAVILPSNGRPRNIMNVVASDRGETSLTVVPEHDAMSLTCYVDSVSTGSTLDVNIYILGDIDGNSKLIGSFPQVVQARAEPLTVILPANGNIKIIASYTGAATFEINGKAVSSASLVEQNTQNVNVIASQDDKMYRDGITNSLNNINKVLNLILNHQRFITGVEHEQGDEY